MVSILLGGDIFIDRPSAEGVFDGLSSLLAESDFCFVNLESPLTDATEGLRWRTGPAEFNWFKTRPEAVKELSIASAVTLANNHLMAYGVEGLLQTLDVLDLAGIGHAGAGRTLDDATKPAIVMRKGTRVALLSYTAVYHNAWGATDMRPGMAVLKVHTSYEPSRRLLEMPGARPIVHTWADDDVLLSLERDIAAARDEADVVVVGLHWGISGSRGVEEYQSQLAYACIDAGATIIHGHHPHVHGPMELYQGCPIFYSFGNLVFDTLDALKSEFGHLIGVDTIVARCIVDGNRIVRVEIAPMTVGDNNNPAPCRGMQGEEIARRVLDFPRARDLSGTWNGSKLIIEVGAA